MNPPPPYPTELKKACLDRVNDMCDCTAGCKSFMKMSTGESRGILVTGNSVKVHRVNVVEVLTQLPSADLKPKSIKLLWMKLAWSSLPGVSCIRPRISTCLLQSVCGAAAECSNNKMDEAKQQSYLSTWKRSRFNACRSVINSASRSTKMPCRARAKNDKISHGVAMGLRLECGKLTLFSCHSKHKKTSAVPRTPNTSNFQVSICLLLRNSTFSKLPWHPLSGSLAERTESFNLHWESYSFSTFISFDRPWRCQTGVEEDFQGNFTRYKIPPWICKFGNRAFSERRYPVIRSVYSWTRYELGGDCQTVIWNLAGGTPIAAVWWEKNPVFRGNGRVNKGTGR